MRIIHGAGYSEEDRRSFRPLVYQNIFVSMRTMIEAMERLQIPFSWPESKHHANLIMSQDPYKVTTFEKHYAMAMQWLWRDSGIRACYDRRREFHLLDSAVYYLSNLDRITEEGYIPTAQDVLRSRMPTTGINEYCFSVQKTNLRIVDVGGQKSERKKWIHCFENVIALIYLASLSEYDQCLEENNQEARSRTRRQPRSSSWTCTPACTPAAWTAGTGAGRARAPAASSATTRAPRTRRTSARSSRTCGTRSWPATWTRSTCSDPGPTLHSGLGPARGGRDVRALGAGRGAGRRSAGSSPRPRRRRGRERAGLGGPSPPPPWSAPRRAGLRALPRPRLSVSPRRGHTVAVWEAGVQGKVGRAGAPGPGWIGLSQDPHVQVRPLPGRCLGPFWGRRTSRRMGAWTLVRRDADSGAPRRTGAGAAA
ncbi:guanine nucleotide-binding protein subunit alpha-15 isoform X2 [Hippopotamus amphibius kiboko]|nr:guanine nucleotide-binding protein subunit alpha-15 isoform X2 [Hippopotamus amphibius kiboko]